MSNTITISGTDKTITITRVGIQGPVGTNLISTDSTLQGNGSMADPLGVSEDIGFSICTLADLDKFLVGDVYELPSNRYNICGPLDFGARTIDLVDTNGNYTFNNFNFAANVVTYSGTDPFIASSTTGIVLDVIRMIISTPNATAIDLSDGNSLILEFPVFSGCKQCVNLDNFEFFTVEPIAMVGCETGCVLNNILTADIIVGQWSLGQDSAGTAFTFSGANSERLFMTASDSRPAASESFLDIQASYGGDVAIGLGVHTTGGGLFFKAGSRDQTDTDILTTGVKNVESSKYNGHIVANGNNTVTAINTQNAWVDINLAASAFESTNMERWVLNSATTGETEYTGKEAFGGEVDGSFSVLSPGSQNYELRYVIDRGAGYVPLTDVVIVPFATDSATGTFPLHIPLACVTGDKIKPQVRNIDGEDDITITHFSAGATNQ